MAYDYSEIHCIFCQTPMVMQEVENIQRGMTIRCRGCGVYLTKRINNQSTTTLGPLRPAYLQRQKQDGTGAIYFFIGFIILNIGLYTWSFSIPGLSFLFWGSIIGGILVLKGLADLEDENVDASVIWFMLCGLVVWLMAWFFWFLVIPSITLWVVGSGAGLALILIGYFKSQ